MPMLRHNLDPLFQPGSLLVVSDHRLTVLDTLPARLRGKSTVVQAPVGTVVQIPDSLSGLSTGERVDLVVVCMPPVALPAVLQSIAPHRPQALIVLAHETIDPDPEATRILCTQWAKTSDCALLGPFAFGLQRPHVGLNLSLHPVLAKPGRVALVAQSRSLMAGVLDWADDVHVGFSAALALGDEMDTRLSEVLDYLASDPATDSIAIYLEKISNGREFMSALRSAASVKPVVVLRAGTLALSRRADEAFDAALRRAGAVRVRYFVQLFSALKVFSYRSRPKGRRVVVFSNGEGPAQLALDMAVSGGPIERASLAEATQTRLARHLAPGALTHNPVVTHQPLHAALIHDLISALVQDEGVDGVIVTLAPDARSDFLDVVQALTKLAPDAAKPVLTCLMGDAGMRPLRRLLDDAGVSAFRTPESTANAFGIHASYHYAQQLLLQIQPAIAGRQVPAVHQARQRLRVALAAGETTLSDLEIAALLQDFHVPLHALQADETPVSATEVPCAIRIYSDALLGPIVSFGAGGVLGQFVLGQDGVDLAPLNHFLAKRLVQRSQIWARMLSHTVSGMALTQLLLVLELLSDLMAECPEIETIEVDPLVIREARVCAAAIQVSLRHGWCDSQLASSGYDHMAIRPYPRQWVERVALKNQAEVTVRPIRPDDALALQQFIRGLSDQARYMRFVSMMRELTPRMLARYTQLDYHREFALVATVPSVDASGVSAEQIIGLAHYLMNPDGKGAEYALVVADSWQGQGLGACLMRRLLDAAGEQGLHYVEGMVLTNNRPMLSLMTQKMGMHSDPDPDDPGAMRRVWLALSS